MLNIFFSPESLSETQVDISRWIQWKEMLSWDLSRILHFILFLKLISWMISTLYIFSFLEAHVQMNSWLTQNYQQRCAHVCACIKCICVFVCICLCVLCECKHCIYPQSPDFYQNQDLEMHILVNSPYEVAHHLQTRITTSSSLYQWLLTSLVPAM